MTKPELFIIELLTFENEEEGFFEGNILSQILHLSGKSSIYYYIRTMSELEEVLYKFNESEYRYLHFSCHGDDKSMYTTLDRIQFDDLATLLNLCLKNRRLFLSACQMTNINLAKKIIPSSGCYSIIGPNDNIAFNDAAIFWSSFYHLIFKSNSDAMNVEGQVNSPVRGQVNSPLLPFTILKHFHFFIN
jgi:hypothetical protein